MDQVVIVTSPFIDQQIQLFQEASFNRGTKKLSFKIFSQRGILKNKKTHQIKEDIYDLFTADEYLIGLNHNHHKIYIFDIRKHFKCMMVGQLNTQNGMNIGMRKNNQKFTLFHYNRREPLIFGLFDQKHIFYFRINHLGGQMYEDESGLHNKAIMDIGRIFTLTESISKLEVQYKKMKIEKNRFPCKKSAILSPVKQKSFIQNIELEKSRDENEDYRKITEINVLIKEKRAMRTFFVDWINNKAQVITDRIQEGIYDFCFRNGWDLIAKYLENPQGNQSKAQLQQVQSIQILTSFKGEYKKKVQSSDSHQIYCSEEALFWVDHKSQTIAGVYNKQFHKIQNLLSIPSGINPQNSMIMIQRPNEKELYFYFYVFSTSSSSFNIKRILSPLYLLQQSAKNQLYLSKNIRNIFTPNGLIHPYFQNKVRSYLLQKDYLVSSQCNQIKKQTDSSSAIYLSQIFFEKAILIDDRNLSRFLYTLSAQGQNLFVPTKQILPFSLSRSHQIQYNVDCSVHLNLDENKPKKRQDPISFKSQKFRCNFEGWNDNLQNIIFSIKSELQEVFSTEKQNLREEINKSTKQIQQQLFQNINQTKKKLKSLSVIYNKLSILAQGSNRKYRSKISQNLKIVRSLFVIYDLLNLTIEDDGCRYDLDLFNTRIQIALANICKRFSQIRKMNITQQKTNSTDFYDDAGLFGPTEYEKQVTFGPLMLHEHFSNIKAYRNPKKGQSLQGLLNFLLSNLHQFEQVAYFYFIIEKEVRKILKDQKRAIYDQRNQMGGVFRQSHILQGQQDIQKIYPYMSLDLCNFFANAIQLQQAESGEIKLTTIELKNRIEGMFKLCLRLNVKSFSLYMVQIAAKYQLPHRLIEIVDSVQLTPFLDFDSQSQQPFLEKPIISKSFIENQVLIIKCFVKCIASFQDNQTSNFKQLLLNQIKRILLIWQTIDQGFENYRICFFAKNQANNSQYSSRSQQQLRKVKNYLVGVLVKNWLILSNNQLIRQLQQIKAECLTYQDDKRYFETIIESIIGSKMDVERKS